MMYIHYCQNCSRLHILNGHKPLCPACEQKLLELKIPYLSFVELSIAERTLLLEDLKKEEKV